MTQAPGSPYPDLRAEQLLRSHLTETQQTMRERYGWFYVVGRNGNLYAINDGWHAWLCHPSTGRPKMEYHIRARGVPTADSVLAQKLLLETNPDHFHRVACAYEKDSHLGYTVGIPDLDLGTLYESAFATEARKPAAEIQPVSRKGASAINLAWFAPPEPGPDPEPYIRRMIEYPDNPCRVLDSDADDAPAWPRCDGLFGRSHPTRLCG